jgi:ribonuclease HI
MDCKNILDKLQKIVPVRIHWTKAHVGHEGNETADQLAKEGTRKRDFKIEPLLPVPKTWIKNKIRLYLEKEWTDRWTSTCEARQTKIFFPKPNAKLAKQLLNYDKQTCAKLFRWISSHSFHRYHNHITNSTKFNDPNCRACLTEREETSHLYAHCTGLSQLRMKVLGSQLLDQEFKWTPNQLLSMIHEIDKHIPEEGSTVTQAQANDPTRVE